MSEAIFINNLRKSNDYYPEENVFSSIWGEYEHIIVESLITSFGLDFIVKDQHGGDVDTILNVRKIGNDPNMKYKNKKNQSDYENRGKYNSNEYHSNQTYKSINAINSEKKKNGQLTDPYTGKKVARNADVDLDHIVSAKEIHDDPGRVLAGLDGSDLANCKENLKSTDRTINRSKKDKDIDDYLKKWKEDHPQRQESIKTLNSKSELTDKERKELDRLQKLENINPDEMRKENEKARKAYEAKLNKAYYTSPKFVKDTAIAAGKKGAAMGTRQAEGFVFMEIWFCTKEEIKSIPPGYEQKDMFETVANGIKRGLESAKCKYKELIAKFEEGLVAGALSDLTTTICNIFFTTAKNLVKCIRQIYASIIQAGKILLFNPENLLLGDRIKSAAVIIATGASVLVGSAVGEIIGKTPIGNMPVIGSIVSVFCSSLISGLISCTLLVFLDRSKFINGVINVMNRIPSEVDNYAEIADLMERIAAKLSEIDIELFKKETEKYNKVSNKIMECSTEDELNKVLLDAYKQIDINIPWEGEFDTFMQNKTNKLVFC